MTTEAFLAARRQGAGHTATEIAEVERKERERLVETLHDDALQRLSVARQDLGAAGEDPAALRAVQHQLDELTEVLRTLRRAVHEELLAGMPLGAALERVAAEGAQRGGITVQSHVDPAATGARDPFVLGAVRQLLANVVEHAKASRADITVTARADGVVIAVADDGRGMSREAVERAGRADDLGLAPLRQRLAAIGGTLDIVSEPPAGTTVTCVLPLPESEAQRTLEQALRRERRWSSALVAAMQDGFVVFQDGVAMQVNDRFCAMTGFPREALVGGRDGSPFWPPEKRDALAVLGRGAREADGTETQATLVRRDGSRFPALVAARLISDVEGGPSALLITVKDITAAEQAASRGRLERELGAVVATTNCLRGLLDAARSVTDEAGLDALLAEIARTISADLGWAVVINLYRPAWDDFVVATGHGVPREGWEILEGATYEWAAWTPLLDERFQRRGAYMVPAGEADPLAEHVVSFSVPTVAAADSPDAWRAEDDLLIPFRHTHGHFLGILSLDAPASGRRPSDAELDVLVALAAHAALAVQHAQTTIEGARHAAALDRLLHVSSRIAATREIGPMLEVVAQAIADALGFQRVVVEALGEDERLRPRAVRLPVRDAGARRGSDPLRPIELAMLLDPGFETEGCFLFTREEAAERTPPGRRALMGSQSNGQGWRAWDDHVILVPLRGADDQALGVIWVDDPVDRLLPGSERLQALHAFADLATAAMIASDRYLRLEAVAQGDPLTNLGNRQAFLRELERAAARTARDAETAVVLLVDVAGPPGGGAAPDPAATAEILKAELRRADRAFRLDGGLFALLLSGGHQAPETQALARRVAARISELGGAGGPTVHVGTAVLGPQPEHAAAVLGRAADDLLSAPRRA